MRIMHRREPLILFFGDVVLFSVALLATLIIRELGIPNAAYIELHLLPFAILFVAWVIVFFIVGLYERYTSLLRSRLPTLILHAQTINIVLAAVFFFFVPYFSIAPKTNLAIYLVLSSCLIIGWRLWIFPLLLSGKRYKAILVSGGRELKELSDEIMENPRYGLEFSSILDVDKLDGGSVADRLFAALREPGISIVVLNMNHRRIADILPHLYKPIYSNVQFIDAAELYEDIFERVPLSAIANQRFFEQVPHTSKTAYDVAKRGIDIVAALVLGIVTLPVTLAAALAIKLEDGGPVFFVHERVGERNAIMTLVKFRSMRTSDRGSWVNEGDERITCVGHILRKLRIDELPQLWNVIRGDLSLVGPRPDIIGLYEQLAKEIPHYDLRYTTTPGLTGWAQIKQRYAGGNISPRNTEETHVRLQYDLYYIKRRSFMLDGIIMLRTIWIVFGTPGS